MRRMIRNAFIFIGSESIRRLESIGRISLFFVKGMIQLLLPPFQAQKILDQIWFIGAKSMFVIVLTAVFTGMVLGLQGYHTLVRFGSEAALGSAVSLTLIRELGPVLTAIMITARAGSAMAAELGVMRMSEQIDALTTMEINPIRFTFSPRLAAGLVSFPLLTAVFDVVGIFGGYISGVLFLDINRATYMDKVIRTIGMSDINEGFLKAMVFSFIVISVCCFRGFYAQLNREGGPGGQRGFSGHDHSGGQFLYLDPRRRLYHHLFYGITDDNTSDSDDRYQKKAGRHSGAQWGGPVRPGG